jgi:hypothetical protein
LNYWDGIMAEENPTNPFEDLFDQLADLMRLAQEKAALPYDPSKIPEVEEKLQKLRRDVELFAKMSREVVIASGVDPDEISKRLSGTSKEISEEGKRLLQKGKLLRQEAENLKEAFKPPPDVVQKEEGAVATPPITKRIADEKYTKRRKSKFKRFGGNKDWKPL